MRFWDSSALVTLVVQQPATADTRQLLQADSSLVAWRFSDVEIRSALARLVREGTLSQAAFNESIARADDLWSSCSVVTMFDAVAATAKRLVAVHPLRAADALQLAAALAATDGQTTGWTFVTLDARLGEAAQREGFTVAP